MKAEEERKISFKIRFLQPTKPDSKPINKVYSAKESEFSLDLLHKKCRQIFNEDSKFSLQLSASNAILLDQKFCMNVIEKSRKGEQQQLIFVCQKIQGNQKQGQAKSQVQVDNSLKQKPQVLQKHSSAKATQQELPKSEIASLKKKQQSSPVNGSSLSNQSGSLNQIKSKESHSSSSKFQPSQSKKAQQALKQSKDLEVNRLDNFQQKLQRKEVFKQPKLLQNQPQKQDLLLHKDSKFSQDLKKQIQAIMNSLKKRQASEEQIVNQIISFIHSLIHRYTKKPQDQAMIAKNITCQQCNTANFKGPVYQCLVCPGKVYFCSKCQAKQELENHPYRAHTMAKIKYPSQFIKKKEITIVDSSDIPLPFSDDEQEKIEKKSIPQEKNHQLMAVKKVQIKNNSNDKQMNQLNKHQQKTKKTTQQTPNFQYGKKAFTASEKQKKLGRLKSFFNATNDEVEKYMKGKYEYMSSQQIIAAYYGMEE